MSSDGGVMLISMAEGRLGVAERLARCIPDGRDRSRIAHPIADMIRARVFAICCGYEDADDLDDLRSDPAFKLACGQLPDTGRDLCSQPDPVAARERARPEGRYPSDLRARRPVDGVLRICAALGQARYRRHLRRGAWPSAALAVQRPLRRALLSHLCPPCSSRAGLEPRGLRPSSPSPIPQTRSESAVFWR
jgi:hypothetical protein